MLQERRKHFRWCKKISHRQACCFGDRANVPQVIFVLPRQVFFLLIALPLDLEFYFALGKH